MNNKYSISIWELFLFLHKIYMYEPELYFNIKNHIIWKPKDNHELKNAVKMYKITND